MKTAFFLSLYIFLILFRWDLQRQREQHMREKLKQQQLPAGHKTVTASRDKHVDHIFPLAEQSK